VVIAVHQLPDDDWLGFTHAYFPAWAFDEYALRDGWAFARKGEGYLALTAAHGLEFITRGGNAYRELRSTAGATCGCVTWDAPRSTAISPRSRKRYSRST